VARGVGDPLYGEELHGALDPWLDRRGAGMALTPAEEAARLRP
jgi:hypothetical protein